MLIMTTIHNLFTLSTTTATRLTPLGTHSGMDITIQNVSDTAYAYIGGEGVTTLNYGYRLQPEQAVSWELPGTDFLYIISDTEGSKVAVLKTNLDSGS